MLQTDYRMQMQVEVKADPGQSFTLTEQDTTVTTTMVHVSVEIGGPRRGNKPPHCQVHWYAFAPDEWPAEVYTPGSKVSGNTIRTLPAEVTDALREILPQAVCEALAERPAKVKRH